jgi:tetratricopeptide (TPR) repeat protein
MDEGRGLARTLYWQGLVYYYQGRYEEAKGVHAQARSLQEALGEERDLVATLRTLADLAIVEKEYAVAEDLCNQALTMAQSLADHGEQAAVFYLLTVNSLLSGSPAFRRPRAKTRTTPSGAEDAAHRATRRGQLWRDWGRRSGQAAQDPSRGPDAGQRGCDPPI